MRRMQIVSAIVVACAMSVGVSLADATVEQKSQVHFGGVVGGLMNVFGGKATHEGATSATYIKGNKKLTRHEKAGELVDLDQEKIYRIDFGRKSYSVVTFDELRKQFEQEKESASSRDQKAEKSEKNGPEYEVDFDVRETGAKEVINGYNTRQVIVTVTVREKGKKLEESGGAVMTSDMWLGPNVPAMKEISDFDRRYFAKLYGNQFGAVEMQQMAVLMATNPAFAKAMKTMTQKRSSLEGTPVRTVLTFETVAGTAQQQASADEEEKQPVSAASVIGGFMKRAQAKRAADKGASPNRSKLFDSNVELLKASSAATASDVAIPSGFTQR